MHNNYYFLRQLTPRLSERLVGRQLAESFSQNRDELVLSFIPPEAHREPFFIKAYLDPKFCCLQFPDRFYRARKNSVDLFAPLIGSRVTSVRQLVNERSFSLEMQSEQSQYSLLFKMHGNRANVVLFQDGAGQELFKSNLHKDRRLSLGELDRTLDVSYERFTQAEGQVRVLYPTFGPVPQQYLRAQGYDDLDRPQQWELLQQTVRQLENPDQFYVTQLDGQWHLSLLAFGEIEASFTNPAEALNAFFLTYIRDERLGSLRRQLNQRLSKEQKQTESYLRKTQQRLQQLTTGLSYQQTADIIMANLHQISEGMKSVTLDDFYHQRPVAIKLNPKLSPPKNAEHYYRKAKNQRIEVAQAEQNIARSEERLLDIMTHQEAIAAIEKPSELQTYAEANGLLRATTPSDAPLPYRRTQIGGYEVLIGKSAKSNDELLRHHAHKDDLWLHAKDVSGSHVLIKQRGDGTFPPAVIEQAAQLAAHYSKRQHDTLAPVMYTPRKYVRKGKNMPAGAVRVEREAVILVEPRGLS